MYVNQWEGLWRKETRMKFVQRRGRAEGNGVHYVLSIVLYPSYIRTYVRMYVRVPHEWSRG